MRPRTRQKRALSSLSPWLPGGSVCTATQKGILGASNEEMELLLHSEWGSQREDEGSAQDTKASENGGPMSAAMLRGC